MGLLKVQGRARVFTEPDPCILSFKIKEENKDYAKCLENLNKRTKRLREAIAKNEIDIHSLKTSDFEIKVKDRYSKGRSSLMDMKELIASILNYPLKKSL